MRLTSDTPLAKELSDSEIREHTVESQIKIGIPFQLRAMRVQRGWTQEALADKLGTTQNTVSRLENPKTGKPTIKTLLRIAQAFDVGLLVRFVPFGFYGEVIEAMDSTHVEVPSYEEELSHEVAAQEREREAMVAGRIVPISAGSVSLTSASPNVAAPRVMAAAQGASIETVNTEPTRMRPAIEVTPNNLLRQYP